jgi:hypothetical protein
MHSSNENHAILLTSVFWNLGECTFDDEDEDKDEDEDDEDDDEDEDDGSNLFASGC